MEYAVVRSGGCQHTVRPGQVLRLQRIDAETGKQVIIGDVLALKMPGKPTVVGTPVVENVRVTGVVLEQDRDAKVVVFKRLRRKGYRRTRGHRQHKTVVRVEGIETV